MCLRFIPTLQAMGASVTIMAPPELAPLTEQFAPTVHDLCYADYFSPILHLLHCLSVTPASVMDSPYIAVVEPRRHVGRKKIGVAWSVGKPSQGDYPREIELERLVKAFDYADLHSVQTQGRDEARRFGVVTHDFNTFQDCADLMMQMDQIVSIDTAALHLAGAIGHPHVFGLLSHWASWRWVAPWYKNVVLCRQAEPGDWSNALRTVHSTSRR
jgi:hypothetical protein